MLDALAASYERWDGRGWPGDLKGDQVPLPARIAQFAEYVEVANRVDGVAGATRMARQRRGKQFDPQVVDALVQDAARDPAAGRTTHRAGARCRRGARPRGAPRRRALRPRAGGDRELRRPEVAVLPRARSRGRRPRRGGGRRARPRRRRGAAPAAGRARPRLRPPRRLERDPRQARAARRRRVGAAAARRRTSPNACCSSRKRWRRSRRARSRRSSRASSTAANAYQAMREPRPHREALDAGSRLPPSCAAGRSTRDAVEAVLARGRPSRRAAARRTGRAHAARGRGAAAARARALEQGDRAAAVDLAEDRRQPRRAHLREDRRAVARGRRVLRDAAGAPPGGGVPRHASPPSYAGCSFCMLLIITRSVCCSSSAGLNIRNSLPGSCLTGMWPGGV